ncbi:hypothetical protein N7G274_003051 [Stereocaulon virgatum]|uniref:DDHD domain-containing protein n=1 Tax=Stereocaulon virgatum TaxID=373712 RepID=A0ABR4AHM2_9LECA
MTSPSHTFGADCLLQVTSNTFTRRASEASTEPPKIRAQFFYSSALPIDDPLSPIPPPSLANKSTRVPPRPFSVHDNIALEKAWLKLQKPEQSTIQGNLPKHIAKIIKDAYNEKPLEEVKVSKQKLGEQGKRSERSHEEGNVPIQARNAELEAGAKAKAMSQGKEPCDLDVTLSDDPQHIPFDTNLPITPPNEENAATKSRSRSPFRRKEKDEKSKDQNLVSARSSRRLSQAEEKANAIALSSSPSERDTTGTPFLRVPPRKEKRSRSPSRSRSTDEQSPITQADGADAVDNFKPKHSSPLRPMFQRFSSGHSEDGTGSRGHSPSRKQKKQQESKPQVVRVQVGHSRLHVVEMPSLKMGPIYWDPVHDVSSVVRGTWFYKSTMFPVEADLANQVEEGYEYMKPWAPAYIDELNSCMEIGPEAELKVVHKIWPPEVSVADQNKPDTAKSKQSLLNTAPDQLDPEEQERQQAMVIAGLTENKSAGVLDGFESTGRLFAKSSIIYANSRDAQILKPSLLPSVAKGRRPLGSIRKGRAVGIPIIRGFDMQAWEKLYPPQKKAVVAGAGHETTRTLRDATITSQNLKSCPACVSAHERPAPTDLILVIHGIGQKLSERVESFHFTHAINAFRRQVNVELESEIITPWLRQDLGTLMVLPINWRSTLKLEEGGGLEPDPTPDDGDPTRNKFGLQDITPESIPAVRGLITDVMLDIPYYLSHHKPKMIEAVTHEANRVYRLWCINNPGFQENGRVHLLAHSLGSIMAIDILSKQPTKLPKSLDFGSTVARSDIFEFDTKSLFFCGSPAGFFLLLNHAPLLPRKGREKPDTEGEDMGAGVAGQAGSFGCLAVDNLYNIMHYNDPVAYRLNACVDADYAKSLQPAFVPSINASWGQYLGSFFRGKAITPTKTMTGLDNFPRRPTTVRMPTTVEMETHNFTKEEIAEKRMLLLNDNGQIDYTLQSGGGLEFQYLNMLSAHSSYWTRQDFIRFLVVEVGRNPGKEGVLSTIKAAKKPFGKK